MGYVAGFIHFLYNFLLKQDYAPVFVGHTENTLRSLVVFISSQTRCIFSKMLFVSDIIAFVIFFTEKVVQIHSNAYK